MDYWLVIGLSGQVFFSARFLVQWLKSELARKSHIPVSFWFLSLLGSALLLTYAIHLRDPVFIIGQSGGFLIYTRNLMLIRRGERQPID